MTKDSIAISEFIPLDRVSIQMNRDNICVEEREREMELKKSKKHTKTYFAYRDKM